MNGKAICYAIHPVLKKIYRKEHTTMKKIVKQINAGDRSKLGNIYW